MPKKNSRLRAEYGRRANRQFYWHIKAGNGEIIAQGEGYKSRRGVLKVLRLLTHFDGTAVDLDSPENRCIETLAKSKTACRCKRPAHYEGKFVQNWPA